MSLDPLRDWDFTRTRLWALRERLSLRRRDGLHDSYTNAIIAKIHEARRENARAYKRWFYYKKMYKDAARPAAALVHRTRLIAKLLERNSDV